MALINRFRRKSLLNSSELEVIDCKLELREERYQRDVVRKKIAVAYVFFAVVDLGATLFKSTSNLSIKSLLFFVALRILAVVASSLLFLLSRGRVGNGFRYFLIVSPYIFVVEYIMVTQKLILTPYFSGLPLVLYSGAMMFPRTLKKAFMVHLSLLFPLFCYVILDLENNYRDNLLSLLMLFGTAVLCSYNSSEMYVELSKKFKAIISLSKKKRDLNNTIVLLKKAEADLIQSEKLASIGTLAAGVAHELNNSLNVVVGLIGPMKKLVSKFPESPEREKISKYISAQSGGLDASCNIINSLLTFSGKNQSKFAYLNLAEILNIVTTLLGAKLRDVTISTNIPEKLQIYGDHTGIYQVFMNLIINATHAMPEGGKINIDAISHANEIVIRASDTGHGIPKEIINKIFDPFFTTKPFGGGTGLGLYVISNVIKNHGGTIKVESTENVGTTFIMTFPKKNPEEL